MGDYYGTTALARIFRLMAVRMAEGGTDGAADHYGFTKGESVLSDEAKRVAMRGDILQLDGNPIGDVLHDAFLRAAFDVLEQHYPGPASSRDHDPKAFSLWVQPPVHGASGEIEGEPLVELFLGRDSLSIASCSMSGDGEITVGVGQRGALAWTSDPTALDVPEALRLLGLREADLVALDEMGVAGIITGNGDFASHEDEILYVDAHELVRGLMMGFRRKIRRHPLHDSLDAVEEGIARSTAGLAGVETRSDAIDLDAIPILPKGWSIADEKRVAAIVVGSEVELPPVEGKEQGHGFHGIRVVLDPTMPPNAFRFATAEEAAMIDRSRPGDFVPIDTLSDMPFCKSPPFNAVEEMINRPFRSSTPLTDEMMLNDPWPEMQGMVSGIFAAHKAHDDQVERIKKALEEEGKSVVILNKRPGIIARIGHRLKGEAVIIYNTMEIIL